MSNENSATEETTTLNFRFHSAVPCPEKAKALGLGRLAYVYDDEGGIVVCSDGTIRYLAWRNTELAVRVTVPKKALEYSQIEMPEKRRHHVGQLEFLMNESIPEGAIRVELTRPDYEQYGVLKVEFDREQVPGSTVVRVLLPLPIAVVEKQINLPRMHMGYECSNAAVCVVVNNVVGAVPPHQGQQRRQQRRGRNTGREQVVNFQLHQIHDYWFNYWLTREEDPETATKVVEYHEKYFWPEMCQLHVRVNDGMVESPQDLVVEHEDTLRPNHKALMNAHHNLLTSIWEGYFMNYVVPETVPFVGGKGQRSYYTSRFPDLVAALNGNKISAMLGGQDRFLPRAEMPADFYCCSGSNDPNSDKVFMTSAMFGRTQSIYRMGFRDGRRQVMERDGEKVYNNQKGHLVILSDLTAHQAEGAVYQAMVNGDMQKFWEQHLLLFPEELFYGDDEEGKRRYKETRRREEQARADDASDEEKETDDSKEDSGSDAKPDVEFGDFSDVVPTVAETESPDEDEENLEAGEDGESEEESEEDSEEESEDTDDDSDDEEPEADDAEDDSEDSEDSEDTKEADPSDFPV
jgi:hypothetical protein